VIDIKTSDDVVKDLIPYVIKLVKETAYVDPNDPRVTDADALGIIVAKYLKWDGGDIMETMFSALEDANFHDLNNKLLKTYEDWENQENYKEVI